MLKVKLNLMDVRGKKALEKRTRVKLAGSTELHLSRLDPSRAQLYADAMMYCTRHDALRMKLYHAREVVGRMHEGYSVNACR